MTLEQCILTDELGYEQYWLAEHHIRQYSTLANPAVFLTACAQQTCRVKLGRAISVLTLRNPLLVSYASVETIEDIDSLIADHRKGLGGSGMAKRNDPVLVELRAHVAACDAATV